LNARVQITAQRPVESANLRIFELLFPNRNDEQSRPDALCAGVAKSYFHPVPR
jgi:hypothetical protein